MPGPVLAEVAPVERSLKGGRQAHVFETRMLEAVPGLTPA
jgi:hypothetical protein